eukprot:1180882-Prorocentrum_minimum.AAC.1
MLMELTPSRLIDLLDEDLSPSHIIASLGQVPKEVKKSAGAKAAEKGWSGSAFFGENAAGVGAVYIDENMVSVAIAKIEKYCARLLHNRTAKWMQDRKLLRSWALTTVSSHLHAPTTSHAYTDSPPKYIWDMLSLHLQPHMHTYQQIHPQPYLHHCCLHTSQPLNDKHYQFDAADNQWTSGGLLFHRACESI